MKADRPHRPNPETGATRVARLLGIWFMLMVAAVGMDAFAYDLQLIAVDDLASGRDEWVVLDARPPSAYRTAHLPGARSFSWEDYTRTDAQKIPYRIWPPDRLAAALGAMGIDETARVAVYGDADTSWGGEGWACWTLIWLGHRGPVRLLQGGVQAWRQAGLPMTDAGEDQGRRGAYHVRLRPEVIIDARTVAAAGPGRVLVDTRSTLEWLTGHLPAAVHLSWKSLYQGEDRRPVDAETYADLLRERGIQATDEVIFYCTGGIRSAYAWVVHQLHGKSPAKNFEGGTEAWKRLSAR